MVFVTKDHGLSGWSITVHTVTDCQRSSFTVAHVPDTVDERISEARAEAVRAAIEAHEKALAAPGVDG